MTAEPVTELAVKVVPRSAKDEIVGWLGGALKVRVMAPPQDGRANRALEQLLATALGLKKNAVIVAAGSSSGVGPASRTPTTARTAPTTAPASVTGAIQRS